MAIDSIELLKFLRINDIEFYTGVYLKYNDTDKRFFLNSLAMDSRNKFFEYSKKCIEVHNRNKHKLNGVVNL